MRMLTTRAVGGVISGPYIYLCPCCYIGHAFFEGASVNLRPLQGT